MFGPRSLGRIVGGIFSVLTPTNVSLIPLYKSLDISEGVRE